MRYLFLLIFLAGCSRLSVRHQYLDERYLASSYVDAPDPRAECGFCGEQIILKWCLPIDWGNYPDLHLLLTVRDRQQGIEEIVIPIQKRRGGYVYRLLNQSFWEHCGILTYKIEIKSGDCVLETWRHQVWAEFISI